MNKLILEIINGSNSLKVVENKNRMEISTINIDETDDIFYFIQGGSYPSGGDVNGQ